MSARQRTWPLSFGYRDQRGRVRRFDGQTQKVFSFAGGSVDPLIVFTRASNGTYFASDGLIYRASTDIARVNHAAGTGTYRGLLNEEERTNILPYADWDNSGGLPTAGWTNGLGSPAPTPVASLYGANDSANAYSFAAAGGRPALTASTFFLPSTGFYMVSVYVEEISSGSTSNVDTLTLQAGTGTTLGTPVFYRDGSVVLAGAAVAVGRLSARYEATAITGGNVSVRCGPGGGGNATCSMVCSRPQLEACTSTDIAPTSYIPVATTAVTRAADYSTITSLSSFFNRPGGAVVVRYYRGLCGTDNRIPFAMSQSGAGILTLAEHVTNNATHTVETSSFGGTPETLTQTNGTAVPNKAALSWDQNGGIANISYCLNGAVAVTLAASDLNTAATDLLFTLGRRGANASSGAEWLNGEVYDITFYPSRPTDAALALL